MFLFRYGGPYKYSYLSKTNANLGPRALFCCAFLAVKQQQQQQQQRDLGLRMKKLKKIVSRPKKRARTYMYADSNLPL